MKLRLDPSVNPPYVALHPKTLSCYHRATKNYQESSSATVKKSENPSALRICTVEAFALLLQELGESKKVTAALVAAVLVNNDALKHSLSVRPESGMPRSVSSGAAKKRRQKVKGQVPVDQ